jgi:anti-sigma factor RsiW
MTSSALHAQERCPRLEALSALVDDELAAPARAEIEAHAASCPVCGAARADLEALGATFDALPQPAPRIDLARLVGERIRVGGEQARRAGRGARMPWWQMLPAVLGAAAALGMGAGAGSVLMIGSGAAARAAVEMSVFATVPPGGLCLAGAACR